MYYKKKQNITEGEPEPHQKCMFDQIQHSIKNIWNEERKLGIIQNLFMKRNQIKHEPIVLY